MSRAATSRLKVNPPLGSPPTLEWRPVGELLIDPVYQRSIDTGPSQSLIRKIAMFWDWGLCQPLAVSRRPDGRLTIVDGQHRASAAKIRGDIPHLPCVITSYANAGDEAAAFVALNQMRRPLNALDLFKAALAAEDAEAMKIAACLASAGLSMAPHTNINSWKPGMLQNVGGLKECLRWKGERTLRDSLLVLGRAYPGEVLRYAGTIFPGIAHIVAQQREISGEEKFGAQMITMLASRAQKQWSAEIIKVSGELNCARRDASKHVFGKAWSEHDKGVILKSEDAGWCEQCDRRVSNDRVASCTDRHCPMAAARAA